MENCICVGRGTTHLEMLFTRVAGGGDEDDPSSSMIHQDDSWDDNRQPTLATDNYPMVTPSPSPNNTGARLSPVKLKYFLGQKLEHHSPQ